MAARRNFYDQTITFECDECGKTFEADTGDFEDAVDDYKAHGGRAKLSRGQWMHLCEECE